mgnify:CR=1 FL=1
MSEFMRLALVEAALAVDKVFPYPGVGAILVKEGHVIGRRHNGVPGEPHAEVKLLEELPRGQWEPDGVVLYTNLEPCCNIGLALSCAQAILNAKIAEVHVAMKDPYHLVRGQGISFLEKHGVNVVLGELEEKARYQNRRYLARFCPSCGWPILD